MIQKIIGVVLLVIGIFAIIVLLTYGGPVFPHIIGPSILAIVGTLLVSIKKKGKLTHNR